MSQQDEVQLRRCRAVQVDKEADADIVVIPYWVDLLCRMSQESELLWDEFNKARPPCH